jgi:hypothetical protein
MKTFLQYLRETKHRFVHGTLADHIPSIKRHGLQAGASDYTKRFYPDAQDALFLAHHHDVKRAVSSIRGQIGSKLNIHPSAVSHDHIAKHGALIVTRGDDHPHDVYHNDGSGHAKNLAGGYHSSPPEHAEPGDYFADRDMHPTGILKGNRLVRFLSKRKHI